MIPLILAVIAAAIVWFLVARVMNIIGSGG